MEKGIAQTTTSERHTYVMGDTDWKIERETITGKFYATVDDSFHEEFDNIASARYWIDALL